MELLRMWIVLCLCVALAVSQDGTDNLNNFFGGKFEGECMEDGFYYYTEARYVICEAGYSAVQDCAPGSRSLPLERYPEAGIYRDIVFCNVNLVDTGYTVMKQPGVGALMPTPNPTPDSAPAAPEPAPAAPEPAPVVVMMPAPAPTAPNPAPVFMVPAPEPDSMPVFMFAPDDDAPVPMNAPMMAPAPMNAPMNVPMITPENPNTESDSNGDSLTHSSGFQKHIKPKSVSYTFYFLHNLKGKRTEKVWGIPTQNVYK